MDNSPACVPCSTLNLMGADVEEETDWQTMRGTLQCELPNANLHVFKGRFEMHDAGTPPPLPTQHLRSLGQDSGFLVVPDP